jgi:hypothetical protein
MGIPIAAEQISFASKMYVIFIICFTAQPDTIATNTVPLGPTGTVAIPALDKI